MKHGIEESDEEEEYDDTASEYEGSEGDDDDEGEEEEEEEEEKENIKMEVEKVKPKQLPISPPSCGVCGKVCSTNHNMRTHMYAKHTEEEINKCFGKKDGLEDNRYPRQISNGTSTILDFGDQNYMIYSFHKKFSFN